MATVKKWPFFMRRIHEVRLFILILLCLFTFNVSEASVPLKDNILFAFEKCKTLTVDLEKGLLKENYAASFDLHCIKSKTSQQDFSCSYFDTGSSKKLKEETFSGSSDLGIAELKEASGKKLKFLIGKSYASFESGSEQKVCAGIFIFEKDALKKRASSPESGL